VFVDGFFLYSFQPEVRAFVNAFRDAYGANPGVLEAYGYDAARLVLGDVQSGAIDREWMLERMRMPGVVKGATGWTVRRADGSLEKQLFLLTMRDGTVHEIERAAPAFSEAVPAARGLPPSAPRPGTWRPPDWDSRNPVVRDGREREVPILRPERPR